MATLNVQNRTLFHSDNLPVLRGINTDSIDLIATDPPFQKGRDFHATPDTLAAGSSFQDRWKWTDEHQEWQQDVSDAGWSDVAVAIELSRSSHSDDMGAFLSFLAVRLIECHRVLKPTGTIYIHCDPTANSYIRILMDSIFGKQNFRNEIIWCYSGGGIPRMDFPRKHDAILRYAGNGRIFNVERKPYGVHNTTGKRATDRDGTRSVEYNPDGTPITDCGMI